MKKLIFALLMSAASLAHATIDTSKLTPAQVAELSAKAAAMTATPENISATVRKEAEAWGEMGANMGRAMVGAAREVGVAANEFASTPLGKVTVAIVAYKIIGKDVLGVLVGGLILIAGWALGIWFLTTKRWSTLTYEYVPALRGLITRKRIVKVVPPDDMQGVTIIVGVALILLATVAGGNLIL